MSQKISKAIPRRIIQHRCTGCGKTGHLPSECTGGDFVEVEYILVEH